MNGRIFNIQRFCVDDGVGVRTAVFFKGCPMHCVWCHNPESQSTEFQLMYSPEKCISCSACVSACGNGLHRIFEGAHRFDREKCIQCGECAGVCFSGALEYCGKTVSAREVTETVLRDREFYELSGGGLTLTGGEPMMQAEFACEIARNTKENNISVYMETSGCCSESDLKKVMPYIDTFLYDFKLGDGRLHKKYTGVSNRIITENLAFLNREGADIILRCPIIPGINLNYEHFRAIGEVAEKYNRIREIHILPYHPLGISKNKRLGIKIEYENTEFTGESLLEPFIPVLRQTTGVDIFVNGVKLI